MEIDELEPSPAFSDRPLGKVKRNGDQIMVKVIWQEMKDKNHTYYPSPIPPGVSVIPLVDVGEYCSPSTTKKSESHSTSFFPQLSSSCTHSVYPERSGTRGIRAFL